MQRNLKYKIEIQEPIKGCVALHLHGVLSTNLKWVSLSQFHPKQKVTEASTNSHPNKCIFDLDHICRYAPHVKLETGRWTGMLPRKGLCL